MIKRTILCVGLWLAAGLASAAEAGKVIFVAGDARADARPLVMGAAVNEGELLSTGTDGYVYIKTLDDGLFILRPKTQARIAAYRVDRVNPANTRVKLELLSGVARTQSGNAVKLARQNFRFNTPVAAIGVRGTDFTVFTDDQTSSVAVLSGGITISGFTGACAREGSGPCEGAASRELSASQKGQMLQIRRGQGAAQLVTGGATPDVVAPPRPDEPLAKAAASSAPEPYIAPQKVAVLQEQVKAPPVTVPQQPQPQNPQPQQPGENPGDSAPVQQPEPEAPVTQPDTPTVPVDPRPPVVVNPDPAGPAKPDPSVPAQPARALTWGRFAAIADRPVQVDLVQQLEQGNTLITQKGDYALLRTDGEFVMPQRGSVGFQLQESEAFIYSGKEGVQPVQATLENGQLRFDFDKRKFSTSFDLVNAAERFNMYASGSVAGDGRFSVDSQFAVGNNMVVDGVLGGRNADSAAYLFQGRLSEDRRVFGATSWGKAPGQ
ncbi:FecR family protein [Massilia sp. MS-15]|uniref:FecR domain-containing protein n=1 Tax=Massilia sp. MS-15 TaxID=2878200 RepID=UPI001CD5BEE0|nr:FecR domain-containing protein [Massilia sp. MS-15]